MTSLKATDEPKLGYIFGIKGDDGSAHPFQTPGITIVEPSGHPRRVGLFIGPVAMEH